MKKIFFSSVFVFLTVALFAQQHVSYTQYMLNQFALNPAVAGLKKCSQTSLGIRRQWTGFEGAPAHSFVSYNTRLNKEDQFPKNFHGIGAYFSNDRLGFSEYVMFKLAYAFHIKMRRNFHFSAGMFGGIHFQQTSFSNIRIKDRTNDPALNDESNTPFIFPEISPGLYIYNNKFFAGLSMYQQYPFRIKEVGTKLNRLTPHYFLMTGYKIEGQYLNYTPSILLSFAPFAAPTVDLTLTVDYKSRISLALGSKYLNSGYATVQLSLGKGVRLGYSYEYALTELAEVAPTTHEIVLQFNACHIDRNKIKVECPAYQ